MKVVTFRHHKKGLYHYDRGLFRRSNLSVDYTCIIEREKKAPFSGRKGWVKMFFGGWEKL